MWIFHSYAAYLMGEPTRQRLLQEFQDILGSDATKSDMTMMEYLTNGPTWMELSKEYDMFNLFGFAWWLRSSNKLNRE